MLQNIVVYLRNTIKTKISTQVQYMEGFIVIQGDIKPSGPLIWQ